MFIVEAQVTFAKLDPTEVHVAGDRLVAGADPTTNGTQFLGATATPDVESGNPYLSGGGPRSAQLGVHFTF